MGSMYGESLRLSLFGQSHSEAVGMTLDGLPAGFPLDLAALQAFLTRRAPGRNLYSTARREADEPEFLGGLVGNVTCGAPLTAILRNTNRHSPDYDQFRDIPRPAHADFAANVKFGGFQDVAGGGHFSARLTAPLCAAGGVCLQILRSRGILVLAHIASIGSVEDAPFDPMSPSLPAGADPDFPVLEDARGKAMREEVAAAKAEGDSVGGVVECAVVGAPAGLGDPIFDGMENRLACILFGIPALKGLEFGSGFAGSALRGSENNDPFRMEGETVRTETNRHGGILGGITSGMPILFRAAFKPTPSIARTQKSVSLSEKADRPLEIQGRHDPCIVPRAVPCVEAATAVAVLDALLCHKKDAIFWEE
ncbi:MAG: chorismate synthase [Oscillospiraceae bacterium]|nr:chorismate synthase [Oscillospiraceae bacterium]